MGLSIKLLREFSTLPNRQYNSPSYDELEALREQFTYLAGTHTLHHVAWSFASGSIEGLFFTVPLQTICDHKDHFLNICLALCILSGTPAQKQRICAEAAGRLAGSHWLFLLQFSHLGQIRTVCRPGTGTWQKTGV